MLIPRSELDRYNISDYVYENFSDESIYREYLKITSNEILEGYESLLTEPAKFLTNLLELVVTLNTVLKYRAIAKRELRKSNS